MTPDDDVSIKLCDFGCTKVTNTNGGGLMTMAGSPQYAAPEVYERTLDSDGYGVKCDLWSVGVVMFVLLGGYAPFESDNMVELAQMICEGDWDFNEKFWKDVTEPPRDLIRKLLVVNPDERYSANEALDSEWLKMRRTRNAINRSSSARNLTQPATLARAESFDNISLDDLDLMQQPAIALSGPPVPMLWVGRASTDAIQIRREKRQGRAKKMESMNNSMPLAPDLLELYSSDEDEGVRSSPRRGRRNRVRSQSQEEFVVTWERQPSAKGLEDADSP